MKSNIRMKTFVLGAVGLLALQVAVAAPKTLYGTNFDVLYDDSVVGLVGQPEILDGATVLFTPTALQAQSLNGQGLVTVSSSFEFQVLPHAGWHIDTVQMSASGDYKMRGASSFVSVSGQTVLEDMSNSAAQITSPISLIDGPLNQRDGIAHSWQTTSSLVLAGAPVFANTTAVKLRLDNSLAASTSSTDSGPKVAFIQNKVAGETISLTVSTVEVPEASASAMGTAGLALLALISTVRRKGRGTF